MDEESAPSSDFTLEYPDAEIVIGIVCAVGTDYSRISEFLVRAIPAFGYRANILKISSFIQETAKSLNVRLRLSARPEARRLRGYMDAGNKIRKQRIAPTFSPWLPRRAWRPPEKEPRRRSLNHLAGWLMSP